jgi:hypothetical protein
MSERGMKVQRIIVKARIVPRVPCHCLVALCLIACSRPGVDTGTEDTGGADTADTAPVPDELLRVVGFNVQSGNSDAGAVADHVASVRGEALWGFSEVENESWASTLAVAAGHDEDGDFDWVLGTTGWQIRLAIAYDTERLELIETWELHAINPGGTGRAPLVAHIRLRSNGRELLFVVNHLWRSESWSRQEQAGLLNEWAQAQTLPVIAVGDYNFDWDVDNGDSDHDWGYDLLTADGVFVWVRPETLVKTQCSSYWDSVLDFVFVSGEATTWDGASEILFPDPHYCDDTDVTSDHRPVAATLTVPP